MSAVHNRRQFLATTAQTVAGLTLTGWASALRTAPAQKAIGAGGFAVIYASNWPVSERFAPLATVQAIIGDYFRSHGRQAEEQVFSLSGKAAYRWVQRENVPR